MDHIEFECGRLLCAGLREYLNRCKFLGMDISYMEGPGFLSRTFIIKGDRVDIAKVRAHLEACAERAESHTV